MFSGLWRNFACKSEDGSNLVEPNIEFLRGKVHGIRRHTLVAVYKTNLLDEPVNEPLGVLLVSQVKGLTSVLDRFSEGLRTRKILPSLLEEVRIMRSFMLLC